MIRKGSFAVCLIAAAAAILSAVAVQCSEVSTPQATKYTLKPPVYATSEGTQFYWGFYGYDDMSLRQSMWGQTQFRGYTYITFGYAENGINNFHIDDYTGSNGAVLFSLSKLYDNRLRVFTDGRVALVNGSASPSERLYVDGAERVTGNLRVDQGIGLGTAPSSNPVIRPNPNEPTTVGAVHGDLAWHPTADPYSGSLLQGNGGWVWYDTYGDCWYVLMSY